jgi:hypothetical protein
VKSPGARSHWIWGAFKMPGRVLHELHALWREPGRGTNISAPLVNEYLARGGEAVGVRAGTSYVDVGTLNGYRAAIGLLADAAVGDDEIASGARVALGRRGPGAGGPARRQQGVREPMNAVDHRLTPDEIRRAPRRSGRGSTTWTSRACAPPRTTSWATTRREVQGLATRSPPTSRARPCSTSAATADSTPWR